MKKDEEAKKDERANYSIGELVPMHKMSANPIDEHYGAELARLLTTMLDKVVESAQKEAIKRGEVQRECECGCEEGCQPTLADHVVEKALLILYYNNPWAFHTLRTTSVDKAIKVANKSFGKLVRVFNLVGEVEVEGGRVGLLNLRMK